MNESKTVDCSIITILMKIGTTELQRTVPPFTRETSDPQNPGDDRLHIW